MKKIAFLVLLLFSVELFAQGKIKLPEAKFKGLIFEETLKKRRSVRDYMDKPLNLDEIAQLLFSAQGISGSSFGQRLRTTPSAGAIYPFEIYLVIRLGEKIKPGIYHYLVNEHSLQLLKEGDFSGRIKKAALGQESLAEASVVFVLTAVFERTTRKYGERGYRYIYIEAGHIGQNILLQATSLGLAAVPLGAFFDEEVNNFLGLDGKKQSAIYLIPVGKK